MNLIDLLIMALATWQAVEIWNHGSIFASFRARIELWNDKLGTLLLCPFCLSVWVAFAVVAIMSASVPDFPEQGVTMWRHAWLTCVWVTMKAAKVFVIILAVSRLANLGNDLSHAYCRTPRSDRLDLKSTFENDPDGSNTDTSQVSDPNTSREADVR